MKSEEFDIFRLLFILKNRIKMLSIIVLCCFIATSALYFLKFSSKVEYASNYTVYSSVLNQAELKSHINLLQDYLTAKDYSTISKKLAISEEESYDIYAISIKSVSGSENLCEISLLGGDSVLLKNFPMYIEHYLKNEVPQEKTNLSFEQLNYKLNRLNTALDSIKSMADNSIYINSESTVSLINSKQDTEKRIADFSLFSTLHSHSIINNQYSSLIIVFALFFFSLSVGIIGVFKWEFFLFLKEKMEEYKIAE